MRATLIRHLGTFVAAAAMTSVVIASAPRPSFPPLGDRLEAGWQRYVAATERRIARETADPGRFLSIDFGSSASRDRQSVLAGGIPIASMPEPSDERGKTIDVPDGWVHDWRGAILIPGVTVNQVIARLQTAVPPSSDVLRSTLRASDSSHLNTFLRVQRRQSLAGLATVTLVYNTEHAVTFTRQGSNRASSASTATRIAEIDRAGSDHERELGAGADHGFMWRWNSYWRYQDTPTGVIAECESLALSRQAPWGTGWIARSLAADAAAESMNRALVSLRDWFAAPGPVQR